MGDRIVATIHLLPIDRIQLAHSNRLVLDITDAPEVAALQAEVARLTRALTAARLGAMHDVAGWLEVEADRAEIDARRHRYDVARTLAEERALALSWAADEIRHRADEAHNDDNQGDPND